MFSEVRIPLAPRAYEHKCYTSEGIEVLRDRTNRVCGVSAESLIVKTAGSIRERLARRHVGDPLAHGEGPRLSTELPDQELGPCKGFLARGSNKD